MKLLIRIFYFDNNKSLLNSYLAFNLENKRNIPIKLRYNKNGRNFNNIIYTSKKQNLKNQEIYPICIFIKIIKLLLNYI